MFSLFFGVCASSLLFKTLCYTNNHERLLFTRQQYRNKCVIDTLCQEEEMWYFVCVVFGSEGQT